MEKSDERGSFFSTDIKAQIWVETVIYMAIALLMIGLVLAYAKPRIEEIQDKIIIEQSIGVMEDIDLIILDIRKVAGNQREIELGIKKGSLKIDDVNDKIIFEMESKNAYTEPGSDVWVGSVLVHTEKKSDINIVNLTKDYSSKYDIQLADGATKLLTKSSVPYKLSISNDGNVDGKTILNIKIN